MDEHTNEDLERKDIVEMEGEAALREDSSEEETGADQAAVEEEETEPAEIPEEPPEEGKPRKIFRRVLIWLVVIALAFAGGFFVDAQLRYQPERQKTNQLRSDLSAAEDRAMELEDEVQRLSVFEERNQALREEIHHLETHLIVISTQKAVADSMLALNRDDLAEARLALDRVSRHLADLAEMLNEDQVEVVENMQQRHELIMDELVQDSSAAMSDLEVLASKLESLENSLFAAP